MSTKIYFFHGRAMVRVVRPGRGRVGAGGAHPGAGGQSFLGFGQSATVAIAINDDGGARKLVDLKKEDGSKEKRLLYYDGESVSGRVRGCGPAWCGGGRGGLTPGGGR